jgi:predicted nucleic acid-binding protein
MLSRVTLDASVAVSAAFPAESSFGDSHRLLELLVHSQTVIVVPTLIRAEMVAAVRRTTGDPDRAKAIDESFAALPGVVFQALDERMADAAVHVALVTGLRGADAVYTATARQCDTTLITLDEEQRTKLPAGVTALYPSEALLAM